jgi:hypothetical protein
MLIYVMLSTLNILLFLQACNFDYADDVNILGGSVHTVKENAEALVVATKETGLEVHADKIKYMIMLRDQNVGHSHSVKIIIVLLEGWKSSDTWER